jgi:hypothetical protein
LNVLFTGVIYIFMFFNAKEERTRYKYLLYYSFSFLENTAIILVWLLHPGTHLAATWYALPALTAHYLTFTAGILFMLCYYLGFHPTGVQWSLRRRPSALRPEPEAVGPTELVQLAREPEPGRGGGLAPRDAEEPDTGAARLLPQMEKVAVGRSVSVPSGQQGDLSAARKLKYMGQKSQEIV